MSNVEIFKLENGSSLFEQHSQVNGIRYWFARDLMQMLGYEHFDTFEKTCINKAIGACTTLKIPVLENFEQVKRELESKPVRDYKLSRFACYLIAMNGDVKKPQVAKAQAYFASMAEAVRQYIEKAENVERVLIRDDVSERERSLSSTAYKAGVENYGFFQNSGYRGLYNMDLWRLREFKGVDSNSCLLDFMGKEELAANLFRITKQKPKFGMSASRAKKRYKAQHWRSAKKSEPL
jgi:DNA-damage-inducible protein D